MADSLKLGTACNIYIVTKVLSIIFQQILNVKDFLNIKVPRVFFSLSLEEVEFIYYQIINILPNRLNLTNHLWNIRSFHTEFCETRDQISSSDSFKMIVQNRIRIPRNCSQLAYPFHESSKTALISG